MSDSITAPFTAPFPGSIAAPVARSITTGKVAAVFRVLRDAVRGTELDLTAAPIGKALVMLAVPMILEMIMESIFAVVDVFWVAHLGPSAVAAIGLTE
ncbi:MAG TPA: MATE family efflux transporter, partial [Kofleriaceae bacterium]|nr:MATE family efflux transporter [Kofleriaceae bacterium]